MNLVTELEGMLEGPAVGFQIIYPVDNLSYSQLCNSIPGAGSKV